MTKKKKQNGVVVGEGDGVGGVVDLESVIHNHALFFDKLIELIPAKFYLPTDDKEKPWFQGLNKAAKAKAKKETKENINWSVKHSNIVFIIIKENYNSINIPK